MSYRAPAYNRTRPLTASGMAADKKEGAAPVCDAPCGKTRQPKMRPFVFVVAAAKRFWTSAQFTTFQNAFT